MPKRIHSWFVGALIIMWLSTCSTAANPDRVPIALTTPSSASTVLPTNTPGPTATPFPTATSFPSTDTPMLPASVQSTLTTTPMPTPEPRIFLASERTNSIQVWQGEPPRFVTAVPVGRFPHNLSVSNDAHWVATANRASNDVSIVDAATLTETVRVRVGQAPHDLSWAPDDARLYVTQERDSFLSVIDSATWRMVEPVYLDTPQHDLAISPDGSQIWATTIRYRGLVIIDRATQQVIQRLAYFPHGSHDITFRPDANEVWVTSSGFIRTEADVDPHIVIFDYKSHQIKDNRPFGLYPFHSVKQFRDGLFLPKESDSIWYSDRGLGGVILISVPERKVLAEIKTGRAPFHLSFGPNGLLYVANHDDATFSVIDPQQRVVLHTVKVAPDPHGIVVTAAQK